MAHGCFNENSKILGDNDIMDEIQSISEAQIINKPLIDLTTIKWLFKQCDKHLNCAQIPYSLLNEDKPHIVDLCNISRDLRILLAEYVEKYYVNVR